MSSSTVVLGVDTGGTFTDFVLYTGGELRVHKVLSRPDAPQEAILQGIRDMDLLEDVRAGRVRIIHGTTVATNAVLEGKGVRAAYVTNRGLGDVLYIGRQTRPALYDLTPQPRRMPLDESLIFEIDCRIGPSGETIRPLEQAAIDDLLERIDEAQPASIAINLLFSFIDSRQEEAIEAAIGDRCFVSRSSAILPEYREYERGMTTWINAWIGPLIHRYLSELTSLLAPARVSIMQSSGLTIAAEQAATRAVNLLLSGPAGGLAASVFIGKALDRPRLMTFDMGGTSTDVALLDGEIRLTSDGHIREFPVGVPMADIHTIGAGGGSIAWIDDGGLLQVGPASAGADPGPACYGKGGTEATVTDANLVLGRLMPDAFLGGDMSLDIDAARRAIEPLASALGVPILEAALGIVKIANEHMTQALRVISVQRGFDPREFTLACFGGAGGLHVCDLAENLEMRECIVPTNGGVLSAFGMLTANPGRELSRTRTQRIEDTDPESLTSQFLEMRSAGEAELKEEGLKVERLEERLDVRYEGQTFTLSLPLSDLDELAETFGKAHEARYGHRLDKPVEIVNTRVHIEGEAPGIEMPDIEADEGASTAQTRIEGFDDPVPVTPRGSLVAGTTFEGPVLVTERHSTTLIKSGWTARVDAAGHLLLTRH